MNLKREKFTYWLIGLGSGIILSGIVMTGTGLSVLSKTNANKNDQKPNTIVNESLNKDLQKIEVEKPQDKILPQEAKPLEKVENKKEEIPLSKEQKVLPKEEKEIKQKEEVMKIDKDQKQNYKTLYISTEANAKDVSELLEKEGLVKDSKLFLKYIVAQGKERKLRSGNFEIPEESTHEDILRILLRK